MCIWQICFDFQSFCDIGQSRLLSLLLVGIKYKSDFVVNFLGPIWFIVVLFFAKIETQYLLSKKNGWIIIILLTILSIFITSRFQFIPPFGLFQAFVASFFLMVGFYLRKFEILELNVGNYLVLIVAVFIIPFLHYFPVATRINIYHYNIIGCVISSIISTIFIFFCKIIDNQQKRFIKTINKIVVFFGQNTLIILCIHTLDDEYGWFTLSSGLWFAEFLVRTSYIILLTLICKRIPIIKTVFNIK